MGGEAGPGELAVRLGDPARLRSASAQARSDFAGSPSSISGEPATARTPASSTARAVASARQYMSQNEVVPVRIISTHASRVPQ